MNKKILLIVMALIFALITCAYASIPYIVGYATGPTGDYFKTPVSVTTNTTTSTYTIPLGTWFVLPDRTSGYVQINTTGSSWTTLGASSVFGNGVFLFSDGALVRLTHSLILASTGTHTLIQMRP